MKTTKFFPLITFLFSVCFISCNSPENIIKNYVEQQNELCPIDMGEGLACTGVVSMCPDMKYVKFYIEGDYHFTEELVNNKEESIHKLFQSASKHDNIQFGNALIDAGVGLIFHYYTTGLPTESMNVIIEASELLPH